MNASRTYVRLRDGVYQYERRVPARIQRDQRRFAEAFGSKQLFRRSLGTKDAGVMYGAARQVHELFERLIGNQRPVAQAHVNPMHVRVVTNGDLEAIADRYCDLTVQPFEQLHRRANVDRVAADELARVEYELELNAEAIRHAVRDRHDPTDAIVLKPAHEARHVIAELGFVAPEDSEERGAVIAAIRSGMERGYRRITALANGEIVPALPATSEPRKREDRRAMGTP